MKFKRPILEIGHEIEEVNHLKDHFRFSDHVIFSEIKAGLFQVTGFSSEGHRSELIKLSFSRESWQGMSGIELATFCREVVNELAAFRSSLVRKQRQSRRKKLPLVQKRHL